MYIEILLEHYINFLVQRLILRQLAPFDWKYLQIGTQRAKDLTKNVCIFLRGGFTPAPWTLLVIRVVLLQWLYELSILSFHKCICGIRLIKKGFHGILRIIYDLNSFENMLLYSKWFYYISKIMPICHHIWNKL